MNLSKVKYLQDFERGEEPIKAVIIADSFDEKFRPITFIKPKALLPIVNRCMIDYTIEMLADSGIKQVLVVIRNHADKIVKWITDSHYYKRKEIKFDILKVSNSECLTMGDALREIDRNHSSLLTGEFILLSGFTISRHNIRHLIDKHRQRKNKNDNILMTAIFNRYPEYHHTKNRERDAFLIADTINNEIVHIEQEYQNKFVIPLDTLVRHRVFDIVFDLNYVGIYITDFRALQFFSVNFDYQTVDDLIRNVTEDVDIEKIVCYDIIDDGYVGTVSDLKLYHSISCDILQRWTYPTVPDTNGYTYHSQNVYLGKDVDIDRTAEIKSDVAIGNESFIGCRTLIDHSVIGSKCYIGGNSTIINSYIWSNVKIESNCTIYNSIICDDAVILHHTQLKKGCIVSFGVTVGPQVVIPKMTIMHLSTCATDFVMGSTKVVDLGESCNGSIYTVHECDRQLYEWGSLGYRQVQSSLETFDAELSEIYGDTKILELDNDYDFCFTVRDVIFNGINDNVPIETIVTEINIAKHTYNMSIDKMDKAIGDVVTEFCIPDHFSNSNDFIKYVNKQSELVAPFCKRYFATNPTLMSLAMSLEAVIYESIDIRHMFVRLILQLYYHDIMDAEFISQWKDYDSDDININTDRVNFRRKQIMAFLKWLEEQQESDESEDSD